MDLTGDNYGMLTQNKNKSFVAILLQILMQCHYIVLVILNNNYMYYCDNITDAPQTNRYLS